MKILSYLVWIGSFIQFSQPFGNSPLMRDTKLQIRPEAQQTRVDRVQNTPPEFLGRSSSLTMSKKGFYKRSSNPIYAQKETTGLTPNPDGHRWNTVTLPSLSRCQLFRSNQVSGTDFPFLTPEQTFQAGAATLFKGSAMMVAVCDHAVTQQRIVVIATQWRKEINPFFSVWTVEGYPLESPRDLFAPRLSFANATTANNETQLNRVFKYMHWNWKKEIQWNEDFSNIRSVQGQVIREVLPEDFAHFNGSFNEIDSVEGSAFKIENQIHVTNFSYFFELHWKDFCRLIRIQTSQLPGTPSSVSTALYDPNEDAGKDMRFDEYSLGFPIPSDPFKYPPQHPLARKGLWKDRNHLGGVD